MSAEFDFLIDRLPGALVLKKTIVFVFVFVAIIAEEKLRRNFRETS